MPANVSKSNNAGDDGSVGDGSVVSYQPYIQNQRPHIVRADEEQWPGLLTAGKLFPLLPAALR